MMQEETSRKPRRVRFLPWLLIAGGVIGLLMLFLLLKPSGDVPYQFMQTIDHPISVMGDHSGRWFYYGPGRMKGSATQIAAGIRKELLPLGFTEDTTGKPWFRFVNGNREVIVCNHDEIAANSSLTSTQVVHETPSASPPRVLYPVVWVHQPGTDMTGLAVFQVKKLLLRW